MLGRLDESHIIRTIEYWDVERRKWTTREHRAVIVAEEITNRFFNVIALFNRAIPIIAIQLNALQLEDKVMLNFTTVLDIFESPEEEGEDAEPTDRDWWERRSNKESLAVADRIVQLAKCGEQSARVTYNRHHIAVGGQRQNFCWLHPRKAQAHCHFHLRIGADNAQSVTEKLESSGISVAAHKKGIVRVIITPSEIKQYQQVIAEVLQLAHKTVGGSTD